MLRLPAVDIKTSYVRFSGGLDIMSPVLSIKPGNALAAMNYESGLLGGYKRIDGFERFDGRPSPSAATYHYVTANITGVIAVGNTVTGATSAATGVVAVVGSGVLALTKVTGTFQSGETINVSGSPVGSMTMAPLVRGYPDGYSDAVALAASADNYRADIQAVPGSGKVLGVNMYKGTVYAFRNNVGGTAADMYKSTPTGWTKVDLGEEILFTNANTSVGEGDTLTQGGITATIKRVVIETGTLQSGTNSGRLILSGRAGGNFATGSATSTGGGTITLAGAQTAITLQPSGRFEFVNTNFSGSTDTFRMYGCDGKNRAFEFDGTVFAPIATGMTEDTPKFITAHKKKLWLAFKGSVQNSGDGNPYVWTVTLGADEIGEGEEVTGMLVQPGEVLAIFTRNATYQLTGSTNASFAQNVISPETGAIPYTAQNIGVAYALDDRGVVQITRTQAYGNFEAGTISRLVQPIIDAIRGKAVASTTYKSRNQYRVYASDGTGFILTLDGNKVAGFTQFEYPVKVTCVCSSEDSTGKDVIFFGDDQGYVYQADKGSSFDGAPITAHLRMPFNNLASPRYMKRYRKAVLEMNAVGYSEIRFQPEFSYGDPGIASHPTESFNIQGAGGYWDEGSWDSMFYDARLVASPEMSLSGTGINCSLIFYSSSIIDLGHTLQGCMLHYSLRRLSR